MPYMLLLKFSRRIHIIEKVPTGTLECIAIFLMRRCLQPSTLTVVEVIADTGPYLLVLMDGRKFDDVH